MNGTHLQLIFMVIVQTLVCTWNKSWVPSTEQQRALNSYRVTTTSLSASLALLANLIQPRLEDMLLWWCCSDCHPSPAEAPSPSS